MGLTEFTLTNIFLKSFDTYILLAEIVRLLGPVLFEILCTFELLTFEMSKNQIIPYHQKSEASKLITIVWPHKLSRSRSLYAGFTLLTGVDMLIISVCTRPE